MELDMFRGGGRAPAHLLAKDKFSEEDFLILTDSEGSERTYSGTKLAGREIVLPGSSFSIRLDLDYVLNEFGFRITQVEPMTQDEYDDYLAAVSANPYETHIFFGTTYISGYLGSEENLVLPTELNGRPVSGILIR